MWTVLAATQQVRALVDRLAGTDRQIAVTAALVLLAGLIALVIVPLVVRQARRLVASRYLGGWFAELAERVNERFPFTTPVRLVLRIVQGAVLTATILGLFVVWDLTWVLIEISRPLSQFRTKDFVGWAVTTVVLLATYVGMGLIEDAVAAFGRETNRLTAHQEQIVARVGQLGLLIVVALVLLGFWGVDLGGLLVGAGFLGIVVGLAARQTLGSLIAGFVLMFSRPFEIGDWVTVGDVEGIVTDITIVNTRLENFDGEFVVIPNDKVADRAITNRSQKGRLRLRVDVGVDYETDVERAVEVAEDAAGSVDCVEETPPPHVFPREFGDSAIVLEVRFWIEHPTPPKRWRAQSRTVAAIKAAYDRKGIKIPYPQRELSGRAETDGFRVHDDGASDAESPPEFGPDPDRDGRRGPGDGPADSQGGTADSEPEPATDGTRDGAGGSGGE